MVERPAPGRNGIGVGPVDLPDRDLESLSAGSHGPGPNPVKPLGDREADPVRGILVNNTDLG